ncbi:MAG: hypothetical protein MRY72_02120, partial [Aquisalinus sp.]|nr:hypothetical protein [Aquisalinus sp.]
VDWVWNGTKDNRTKAILDLDDQLMGYLVASLYLSLDAVYNGDRERFINALTSDETSQEFGRILRTGVLFLHKYRSEEAAEVMKALQALTSGLALDLPDENGAQESVTNKR